MKNVLLCMATLVLGSWLASGQVQYNILWNFAGAPNDGYGPRSGLVFDHAGNLYGTTYGGGNSTAPICFPGGCGTVFELSPNGDGTWTNSILYSFCGNYQSGQCIDGAFPEGSLILDGRGNLYGTTSNGGNQLCENTSQGCGTVFKISLPSLPGGAWTERVLYNFCSIRANNGCSDGSIPVSQLTFDASGNLYGTTSTGGTSPRLAGTIFELSHGVKGWTEAVLYSFCSSDQGEICPDGLTPLAGVTFDRSGNLYGTTERGGSQKNQGNGTVYKLSPGANGWTEAVVFSFGYPFGHGQGPTGTVSFDALGNLFSTASSGGQFMAGTVIRLSSKGGGKVRTFSFNHQDGNMPMAGVLIDSRNATIYGTTFAGGTAQGGTAFEMVAPAQESVLYNFCSQQGCTDGAGPSALIADKSGNLYGTTKVGGANNAGVVFEIIPQAPNPSQHASVGSLLENAH
jgi:uncharacterized repeat protein (TIGR03803 family)